MSHISTSRRGVIGALALSPVAIAAPAVAGASALDFNKALAEYNNAWLALNDHPLGFCSPSDPRWNDLIKDSRIYSARADNALDNLLRCPSPDGNALATKIEVLIKEYEDSPIDECRLELLITDARRLGGAS